MSGACEATPHRVLLLQRRITAVTEARARAIGEGMAQNGHAVDVVVPNVGMIHFDPPQYTAERAQVRVEIMALDSFLQGGVRGWSFSHIAMEDDLSAQERRPRPPAAEVAAG